MTALSPPLLGVFLTLIFTWVFAPAFRDIVMDQQTCFMKGDLIPIDIILLAQADREVQPLGPNPIKTEEMSVPAKPSKVVRQRESRTLTAVGISPPTNQTSSPTNRETVTPSPNAKEKYAYRQMNTIMEELPTSFVLDRKVQKGGICFRLRQIALWKDEYLIKCSVANESDVDFFVSLVKLLADGKQVEEELVMPFSCRPKEEIHGIARVKVKDLAKKSVSLELWESGGERRRLLIREVRYAF
jgi:hypothetical protein